ncbi:uncharacterized protein LOC125757484 [Rhipicephalus sanguineus]|uniref:uncharacterized protein LOC125757484 n=1 Tax=Rhipicephalus sanguineus TaxID=34632 RepID=UPI0020C458B2|nr:uncharacterized protein LOC125757484 [Rhipicephalus sanguineus]
MSAARHGADARAPAGASSARAAAAARDRVAVEELPGPAFASSSGGLSGALMSLVIFALFLIFIVTMTARYLRTGQPAAVPQLVTAAVSSRNLTFHDNGTARAEQEEAEPAVAASGNLTLLETALQPVAAANRSS